MGPLSQNHPTLGRPATRDRPLTRDHGDHSLIVPSRTSSLHSRITQPPSSSLSIKVNYKTPKTLTHAYLVCGIAREPSHWVKAPMPTHGKIIHTKGGTGQFWLPEILGSSPRLEQDNEIARALYSAMRVCHIESSAHHWTNASRLVSPMTRKSARVASSRHTCITRLCFSKTHLILSTELPYACGRGWTRNGLKPPVRCGKNMIRIITTLPTRYIGFRIA